MKILQLEDIKLMGDLGIRAMLLGERLEGSEYRPENIFSMDQSGWPADWEGRTILAVTLISQLNKKEPVNLDSIIEELDRNLNEKGYLKEVILHNQFNEQQLSGHSWMLRGLIELYNWRKSDDILRMIKGMVENLFLPTRGFYGNYPIQKEDRTYHGEKAGEVFGHKGNWFLSSDTGCVYIPIDGLSHAYELLGGVRILDLLEEMIENFLNINLTEIQAQTHATLSATRGILRTYGLTKSQKYLDAAIGLFDLYINEGMTATFANYNWFGRPQWTEPCAIIDSFIVANELFRYTGKPFYLDWAQKIWYNGVEHAQRENGGFGCDTCAGAAGETIANSVYEAYWCCTMRGGEGLAKCAQYSYIVDEKDNIFVGMPQTAEATLHLSKGSIKIKQTSDYPYIGRVHFEVLEDTSSIAKIPLHMYIPAWAKDVSVNGKMTEVQDCFVFFDLKDGEALVEFDIPTFEKHVFGKYNGDKIMKFHGNLVLGTVGEEGVKPINNTIGKSRDKVESEEIKVIF